MVDISLVREAVHFTALPVNRFVFSKELAEFLEGVDHFKANVESLETFLVKVEEHLDGWQERFKNQSRFNKFLQECLRKKGLLLPRSRDSNPVERLKEHFGAEFRWVQLEARKKENLDYSRYNPTRGYLWKKKKHKKRKRKKEKKEDVAEAVKETHESHDDPDFTGLRRRGKKTNKTQVYQCRQCQHVCDPPKRSFCSAACLHLYKIRSNPRYIRQCLLIRDGGICDICGLHTEKLRRVINRLLKQNQQDKPKEVLEKLRRELFWEPAIGKLAQHLRVNKRGRVSRGCFWNADHILAVSQGGGNAALEWLRTLCVLCHRTMTGQLRRTPQGTTGSSKKNHENGQGTKPSCVNEATQQRLNPPHSETAQGKPFLQTDVANIHSGLVPLRSRLMKRLAKKKMAVESEQLRQCLYDELFQRCSSHVR